jgi:hypothetical protein
MGNNVMAEEWHTEEQQNTALYTVEEEDGVVLKFEQSERTLNIGHGVTQGPPRSSSTCVCCSSAFSRL